MLPIWGPGPKVMIPLSFKILAITYAPPAQILLYCTLSTAVLLGALCRECLALPELFMLPIYTPGPKDMTPPTFKIPAITYAPPVQILL